MDHRSTDKSILNSMKAVYSSDVCVDEEYNDLTSVNAILK